MRGRKDEDIQKVGLWIDRRRALIVAVTDKGAL
jgi:hypothetical protein